MPSPTRNPADARRFPSGPSIPAAARLARSPFRYLVALLAVGAAVGLRWLCNPLVADSTPYLLTFPAVMFSSLLVGPGPALVAAVLGLLATETWIIPPVGELGLDSFDLARGSVVLFSAGFVGVIGKRLWKAQELAAKEAALAREGERLAQARSEELRVALLEVEKARAQSHECATRFLSLADNIAQLAWTADARGSHTWFNRRWYEYTGTTPEEMEGAGWERTLHPEHAARVVEQFRRKVLAGEPWEDTFPLRGAEGSYRWFLSRAFPLRGDAGVVSWFGTHTDVTAQVQAEEALREADRRKDEFIAVLAHELRNPLAPVRVAAELLKSSRPGEAAFEKAREIVARQITHMARLIDDLLDVSRITRGKLALAREQCDLAAIALQTAEDYRANLESAGLQFVVSVAPGPLPVEGDPVRLAQMIGNLLHNSARFTERGGQVEVRTRVDEASGEAVVAVIDSGVGIEPSLLPRLFDPFAQADQDLARSKGGLGLGLALTRGLAEAHGGRVEAWSAGRGSGATFTVRVPLHQASIECAAAEEPLPRHAEEHLRILVVEDQRDTAETLGELLGLRGHSVRVAFDAATAVATAREFQPQVVISDLGLPGELDGYGLARALRAEPACGRALLIALSGYMHSEARQRSYEAGFDSHLAKPPDLAVLNRTLLEYGQRR